jgi:hypothetical protein
MYYKRFFTHTKKLVSLNNMFLLCSLFFLGFAAFLFQKVQLISQIQAQGAGTIDSGSVAAFDLSSCPSGWTEYTEARGRMIVGTNPTLFSNPNGEGNISARTRGSSGGEEKHKVTTTEMAAHSHQGWTITYNPPYGYFGYGTDYVLSWTTGGSAGGDLPHNEMQLYVSLLYCQKT